MGLFRCRHPFASLAVTREQEEVQQDQDWILVTYHLHCTRCGGQFELQHVRTVGGVAAYLGRKPEDR